jgi:hypothetical protein
MGSLLLRYLNPWGFRRDKEAAQLRALRQRDGDNCRRCRRPIRFDLPAGHDLGFRLERIAASTGASTDEIDNLCLTHGRCNVKAGDDTIVVMERLRPMREAELLSKARNRRRKKAA